MLLAGRVGEDCGMASVTRFALALLMLVAGPGCPSHATDTSSGPADGQTAEYRVRVLDRKPLRLGVTATLPADGDRLLMSTTRPGGIAQLDEEGWPAIVADLRATDAEGIPIGTTAVDDEGWHLARVPTGRVVLHYEVDYSVLSVLGWPAPRESAFADDGNVLLAGRSLFVTTPAQTRSEVAFDVPDGWHVAAPWRHAAGDTSRFRIDTTDDLVDNLFVLAGRKPETIVAGRFTVAIVAMGRWRSVDDEVLDMVAPIARRYVEMMPLQGQEAYLMVLLPHQERGGESFRNSFAMSLDEAPSAANRENWGNTLAHELFHYWNGWRLRGKDYAATQWFQEGFTEYEANKALLAAGLVTPTWFLDRLSRHIADYRRLETPLDAPGTRKGPPLYGGGALAAFCWDVQVRAASNGKRDLGDMFATLWRATDRGAQAYDWHMIRGALQETAAWDWSGFHARHIAAREPLPVEAALQALGLKRLEQDAGAVVAVDPDATPEARARWQAFIAR
jgi:predicted metalloprotease with PDZ domain